MLTMKLPAAELRGILLIKAIDNGKACKSLCMYAQGFKLFCIILSGFQILIEPGAHLLL
jgi:hypothetical protein